MNKKILIVEDEFVVANSLRLLLEKADYEVLDIAASADEAEQALARATPDLVLLDIRLEGSRSGIDLARELRSRHLAFVYLSAHSSQKLLEEAKATEPYGFLVKPFREKDLLITLDIAWYRHRHSVEAQLRRENTLRHTPGKSQSDIPVRSNAGGARHEAMSGIIGEHPLLLAALELTAQVAPYNTSVLVLGESGTGKENIAKAIHVLSPRKDGPFIKVNCAAIPSSLIESALFGHEKGAFTGATEKHKGSFEQADGGTLFLDEIGELPGDMQVKILRSLQEKEITPIGGRGTKKVNIRIIAATNRNLEKEVGDGKFRLDLYYRLNVFPIMLPPLRERKSDIPGLAKHFAQRYFKDFGKPFMGISASMYEQLLAYHWPGNIRELENIIERSVILGRPGAMLELSRGTMPTDPAAPGSSIEAGFQDIKTMQLEAEKNYLLSVMRKANGRVRGPNGAAELLNMKPTTLESRLLKLGINRDEL